MAYTTETIMPHDNEETQYMPDMWAQMPGWPLVIIPANQTDRYLGFSENEQQDREEFAHPIASVRFDELCTFPHRRINRQEAIATACLIAAAPELLEACQLLLAFLRDSNPGGFAADAFMASLADKADAAIAKATGQGETK